MSLLRFPLTAVFLLATLPLPAAEMVPPMGAPVFNHVRFFPAPSREENMVGGKFSGSNVSATEGFHELAEIKEKPREQEWTDLFFSNNKLYRWLRYDAPPGSHGCIAEMEFYSGKRKVDGYRYGSIGDLKGKGWRFAFDGDTKTWVEMEEADGQYAGVDLVEQATARMPKFLPAPGGVDKPLEMELTELTPYATVRYTLDGSMPTATTGEVYQKRIKLEKTTTVIAAAFVEGWAPSPPLIGTYLIGDDLPPGLNSLHIGNTLTDMTAQFPIFARTAGREHLYRTFTVPGAWTNQLWAEHTTGRKREWGIDWDILRRIDHLTLQPRDFNIAEEAQSDRQFIDLVRTKTPEVQPWLFVEWVEKERPRPSDRGEVPSSQMTQVFPALTWEESMGAMLLYVEDVRRAIAETDKGGKRVRVLPTNLAMGWIRNMIEHGQFPGAKPTDFYPLLFRDSIHPSPMGAYLVDLTWYAAFYRESPEGKVLPVGTNLTPEQATVMQRLAWDVIQNYPDCGIYEEGKSPTGPPEFSPAARAIKDITRVTLSSTTPGAWFRYTLDGTTPTRTTGYVYCGVISVRPGMTVKAVAFKNGMADSAEADAMYSVDRPAPTPRSAVKFTK
ncbi:MAG: chitobiase/beta-hexosaminidase C-terminal domain-containing protein [Chthoniobacter sp.]|uniref:chitobiase/beta-hexosaminidase C-terminal domain-containing protein n=1 Tax=Chthoniobacter sp. TaxID=2510640 RepID=UPI0032AA3538